MVHRWLATAAALLAVPSVCPAQGGHARVEAGLQVSYVPLYGGDATIGRYAGVGPRLSIAVRPIPGAALTVEGFYTRTLASSPIGRPSLGLLGVMAGYRRVTARPGRAVALMAVGIEQFRVATPKVPLCAPPLCFNEGGAGFVDAKSAAVVADLGIRLLGTGPLGLSGDVRLHSPFGVAGRSGASDRARVEFSLGGVVRVGHRRA